jgi:hypothetical protein
MDKANILLPKSIGLSVASEFVEKVNLRKKSRKKVSFFGVLGVF